MDFSKTSACFICEKNKEGLVDELRIFKKQDAYLSAVTLAEDHFQIHLCEATQQRTLAKTLHQLNRKVRN